MDLLESFLKQHREVNTPVAAGEAHYTPSHQPRRSAPRKPEGFVAQAEKSSRSDLMNEIDGLIERIDPMQALRLWGKPQSEYKRINNNHVLIRCPQPTHPDRHPSASLSLDTGLWVCHGCDVGGDLVHLAGIKHGIDPSGNQYPELKKRIAVDLGFTIRRAGAREELIDPNAPAPSQPEAPRDEQLPASQEPVPSEVADKSAQTPAPEPSPAVTHSPGEGSSKPEDTKPSASETKTPRVRPVLDWQDCGFHGSFIDTFMKCVEPETYPKEWAFFTALMCLSFVASREIRLQEISPVQGNIAVVAVGETGEGKTRSYRQGVKVLNAVMPYRNSEILPMGGGVLEGTGVKTPSGVGSGENLIKTFEDKLEIPLGNEKFEEQIRPVDGMVSFNELSMFIGKSSAKGSTLKERVMDMVDGYGRIENTTNTQGDYYAENPFASFFTSVQPENIQGLVTQSDETSGFMNRWIYVTGKGRERDYADFTAVDLAPAIASLTNLKKWWDDTKNADPHYKSQLFAINKRAEQRRNAGQPFRHEFPTLLVKPKDDDVTQYRAKILHELAQLKKKYPIMARIDLMFWKMELLLAINEKKTEIDHDIVDKAHQIVRYLIATWSFVSNQIEAVPAASEFGQKVLEIVGRKSPSSPLWDGKSQGSITARMILNSLTKSLRDTQRLNRELQALVNMGILGTETTHKGTTSYYIIEE